MIRIEFLNGSTTTVDPTDLVIQYFPSSRRVELHTLRDGRVYVMNDVIAISEGVDDQ